MHSVSAYHNDINIIIDNYNYLIKQRDTYLILSPFSSVLNCTVLCHLLVINVSSVCTVKEKLSTNNNDVIM